LHINEKNIIDSDMVDSIKREIDNLTPKQKMVFILKCYEELTYEEIARITKSRVGTVKATYFQVVQKIKKNLGGKRNGM
ncbi:MAG: RNA polymerase sigma factor, partial [Candidatus Omnitrophica bacterium]|nr:RNA polymerase sigma factor [Candidatus Omnitrophota bacterium]